MHLCQNVRTVLLRLSATNSGLSGAGQIVWGPEGSVQGPGVGLIRDPQYQLLGIFRFRPLESKLPNRISQDFGRGASVPVFPDDLLQQADQTPEAVWWNMVDVLCSRPVGSLAAFTAGRQRRPAEDHAQGHRPGTDGPRRASRGCGLCQARARLRIVPFSPALGSLPLL